MGIYEALRYDDEQKKTAASLRLFMFLAVTFLMSGCYSWSELKYSISGVKTTAVVTNVKPAPLLGRNQSTVLATFTDQSGQPHQAKLTMSDDTAEQLTASGKFEVIYLPGNPDENEPVAMRKFVPVIIFVLMSGLMVGWLVKMGLDVRAEQAKDRARSRRH